MHPVESIKTCLFRKYATFSGRANRSEYWWFTVLAWVLGDLPLQFVGALSERDIALLASRMPMAVLWIIVLTPFVLILIFLLPSLAVTCRRLHDIGRSGWWCLVILLSLLVGFGGQALGYDGVGLKMVSAVPMIILLLFLLRKGTDGPNRFGTPPDAGLGQ